MSEEEGKLEHLVKKQQQQFRANKMTQWKRVLAARPDDLEFDS